MCSSSIDKLFGEDPWPLPLLTYLRSDLFGKKFMCYFSIAKASVYHPYDASLSGREHKNRDIKKRLNSRISEAEEWISELAGRYNGGNNC